MYRIVLVDVFFARCRSPEGFSRWSRGYGHCRIVALRPPPDKEAGERRLGARCALGNVAEDDVEGRENDVGIGAG